MTTMFDKTRLNSYSDYVHDQLQRERTVKDNQAILRSRAASRIEAAGKLRSDAGVVETKDNVESSTEAFHIVARMLDEQAFYPAHDARMESPGYAKVHHQMTVVDEMPCLVCGVQQKTLKDLASNPFGAIQLETHHHTIEWALANAVSVERFNAKVRLGLLREAHARAYNPGYAQKPAVYKTFDALYEKDMSEDDIHAWVDHAADNLWVLCDVHHRHIFVGIHSITYPIWGPQDIVDDGLIAKEINLAKQRTSEPSAPAQHAPPQKAPEKAKIRG